MSDVIADASKSVPSTVAANQMAQQPPTSLLNSVRPSSPLLCQAKEHDGMLGAPRVLPAEIKAPGMGPLGLLLGPGGGVASPEQQVGQWRVR